MLVKNEYKRNNNINNKQLELFINTYDGIEIWYNLIFDKNNVKIEFKYPVDDPNINNDYSFFVYRNLQNNLFCNTFFNFSNQPENKMIKNYEYKNFLKEKDICRKYCNLIVNESYYFKENKNELNNLNIKMYTMKDFKKSSYYLIYIEREKFVQELSKNIGRTAILEIFKKEDLDEIDDYLNSF